VVHASVLLDFGGAKILTDPWFSQKGGFPAYYWGEPLGVALGDLPELSGVVSSHGHYDHYDMVAFAAYPDKAVPFAVKRGTGGKARRVGFENVTELDPWETVDLGPVRVTAAPAKHGVPENTYVLEAGGFTVFFGGDTLLIPELKEVAERFPKIDLTLLAVNGLMIRPMLNRQVVMNAREAAELVGMLNPRFAVPIHYRFTGGPIGDRVLLRYEGTPEEFERDTARHAPGTDVRVLAPGEPLEIPWEEAR
jgi:L-ascorbate metabolism protein UlaG (beta-lactamase superfamily)